MIMIGRSHNITFNDFIDKLVRISLEAPTEEMRKSATEFYADICLAIYEDSNEDAEKFMKIFEKNG